MIDDWVLLAMIALWVGSWIVFFHKAGYPAAVGLTALILPLPVFIALGNWPIRKEVAKLRVALGKATEADTSYLLSRGVKLEQRGDWDRAIALFRFVADGMKGHPSADDAARLIDNVRQKQVMHGEPIKCTS